MPFLTLQKTSVVLLQDIMMDNFLTSATYSSKAIVNIFTNVPEFTSETEMYNYITESVARSGEFSRIGMTFVAHQSNLGQPIICGTYASGSMPTLKEECAASNEPRHLIWTLADLLVVCKLDSVSEDPFHESSTDNETPAIERRQVLDQMESHVELVFKYQQRTFAFVVLFLGRYARVVRFDRSGIVVSEKIDYTTADGGTHLSQFFVDYAGLQATNRGHDPTASRIFPSDPLGMQLKELGTAITEKNPEYYGQKLFNQSLDEEWPWWKLSVPSEDSGRKRWFAVGKPHFYAGGVIGRGTRGYVAAPLGDDGMPDHKAKVVYLKDVWRVGHEAMETEGTVLEALDAAKVPFVPTVLCHGDLGQTTQSYDRWPDYHSTEMQEACPLKSHRHYRLVVAEVGKPLSVFEDSLWRTRDSFRHITAYERLGAGTAGCIHRDLGAGNILRYLAAASGWTDLLNDWELSKKYLDREAQGCELRLDRTARSFATVSNLFSAPIARLQGIWQFMSAHRLLACTKPIEVPDDLESFFHVLIYVAVRFLPHNLSEGLVETFLHQYFNDYMDGDPGYTCGPMKYNAIKRGVLDITTITGSSAVNNKTRQLLFFIPPSTTPPNSDKSASESRQLESVTEKSGHPINKLINELLKAFQAFYAKDDVKAVHVRTRALSDPFVVPPEVLAAAVELKISRAQTAKHIAPESSDSGTKQSVFAAKVETHEAIRRIILYHLVHSARPKLDKGDDNLKPKPKGEYVPANEDTHVGSTIPTGSKRRAEKSEGTISKRSRAA